MKTVFMVFCYISGAVLTFGYQAHHGPDNHTSSADFSAMGDATIWPIYWPFRISYLAFEPERP